MLEDKSAQYSPLGPELLHSLRQDILEIVTGFINDFYIVTNRILETTLRKHKTNEKSALCRYCFLANHNYFSN